MNKEELRQVADALKAAHDHLEYCGYGDSWERECAVDEGLPERIEEALRLLKDGGFYHHENQSH